MKKKLMIVSALSIICLIIFVGIIISYKFIEYEKKQNERISTLSSRTEYLEEKLTQTTDYYNYQTNYTDDTYNYFAIGNSLTLITSIGRGICATQPDNDYFNLVVKALEMEYGEVVAYPYNFATWERYSTNRSACLDLIDPYLSDKLNLVSVQLGENAYDITSYEDDLKELIDYIKDRAPNAMVIIIGDWWNSNRNDIRKTVASDGECMFADLSAVMGDVEYQSKTGTIYYLSDGSTELVTDEAATHPGDLGMEYIADKVMEVLKIK